jgi:hypothetical protein
MTAPCSVEDCARTLQAATRSKYRTRKTAYAGRVYDSAKGTAYARELDLREQAGDIRAWKTQVRIALEINGHRICVCVADFLVTHVDGREELIEVKGHAASEWLLKERLFRALYPERSLAIVRS